MKLYAFHICFCFFESFIKISVEIVKQSMPLFCSFFNLIKVFLHLICKLYIYDLWKTLFHKIGCNLTEFRRNKAFALTRPISHARYILVTRLDRQLAKDMLFTGAVDTVEEALEIAKQFVGEKPSIILMPEGSLTVPRVE